jgi:hypothetical protein
MGPWIFFAGFVAGTLVTLLSGVIINRIPG